MTGAKKKKPTGKTGKKITPRAKPKKKVTTKKAVDEKKPAQKKKPQYIFAVGRRKSSVARVRLYKKEEPGILINDKEYTEYFPQYEMQLVVKEPFKTIGQEIDGKYSVKVSGGGPRGQAESVRLGICRILLKIDPAFRPVLKARKLLVRDPRVKERKKYGLRKARRAPQWQKR